MKFSSIRFNENLSMGSCFVYADVDRGNSVSTL
jgi:hypothetical protein